MKTIRITGHINEAGQLKLDQPADLPPGDVVVTIESVSPEEIAADEERWSKSFAASQDALSRMADQALKDLDEGLTDELDPDNL